MTSAHCDGLVLIDANFKDRGLSLASSLRTSWRKGRQHNELLVPISQEYPDITTVQKQHSSGLIRRSYFHEGLNNRNLNRKQKLAIDTCFKWTMKICYFSPKNDASKNNPSFDSRRR